MSLDQYYIEIMEKHVCGVKVKVHNGKLMLIFPNKTIITVKAILEQSISSIEAKICIEACMKGELTPIVEVI